MTPREKVLNAEAQIRAMLNTGPAPFDCPFCGLQTDVDQDVLCCDSAADVIEAVLDHLGHRQTIDLVDCIMDRYEKASMN